MTAPEALRGAVQRTMSADCGVVRDAPSLRMAADTLADLAALADDLPAREIATYEVINLLRVSRAIVAAAPARAGVARLAHAQRLCPDPTTRWLGRLVIHGDERTALRRAPGARPRETLHDRLRCTRRPWSRRWSRPRSPKTSGCSATSRRSRASGEDQTAIGRVRRARRRRARRHRARRRDLPPGRRRGRGPLDAARRRPGRSRARSSAESRAAARRSSPASGSALNFLCHCSGVASLTRRYVRAARARPASSTRARRCPVSRRAEGGGARRRRLQPPRLARRPRC